MARKNSKLVLSAIFLLGLFALFFMLADEGFALLPCEDRCWNQCGCADPSQPAGPCKGCAITTTSLTTTTTVSQTTTTSIGACPDGVEKHYSCTPINTIGCFGYATCHLGGNYDSCDPIPGTNTCLYTYSGGKCYGKCDATTPAGYMRCKCSNGVTTIGSGGNCETLCKCTGNDCPTCKTTTTTVKPSTTTVPGTTVPTTTTIVPKTCSVEVLASCASDQVNNTFAISGKATWNSAGHSGAMAFLEIERNVDGNWMNIHEINSTSPFLRTQINQTASAYNQYRLVATVKNSTGAIPGCSVVKPVTCAYLQKTCKSKVLAKCITSGNNWIITGNETFSVSGYDRALGTITVLDGNETKGLNSSAVSPVKVQFTTPAQYSSKTFSVKGIVKDGSAEIPGCQSQQQVVCEALPPACSINLNAQCSTFVCPSNVSFPGSPFALSPGAAYLYEEKNDENSNNYTKKNSDDNGRLIKDLLNACSAESASFNLDAKNPDGRLATRVVYVSYRDWLGRVPTSQYERYLSGLSFSNLYSAFSGNGSFWKTNSTGSYLWGKMTMQVKTPSGWQTLCNDDGFIGNGLECSKEFNLLPYFTTPESARSLYVRIMMVKLDGGSFKSPAKEPNFDGDNQASVTQKQAQQVNAPAASASRTLGATAVAKTGLTPTANPRPTGSACTASRECSGTTCFWPETAWCTTLSETPNGRVCTCKSIDEQREIVSRNPPILRNGTLNASAIIVPRDDCDDILSACTPPPCPAGTVECEVEGVNGCKKTTFCDAYCSTCGNAYKAARLCTNSTNRTGVAQLFCAKASASMFYCPYPESPYTITGTLSWTPTASSGILRVKNASNVLNFTYPTTPASINIPAVEGIYELSARVSGYPQCNKTFRMKCGEIPTITVPVTTTTTVSTATTSVPQNITTTTSPPSTTLYCTQTQGGWGANPAGQNTGALLSNNWQAITGGTLRVGKGTYSITLSSASAVANYLPSGGRARPLDRSYTNPTETASRVFGGQVTALKLNVLASDAGIGKESGGAKVGDLYIQSGPFAGRTVRYLLDLSESVLGADRTVYLPRRVTITVLNDAIDKVNNEYVDCRRIGQSGYLRTSPPANNTQSGNFFALLGSWFRG